ncbi:MAG: hypothetical protein JXA67_21870 [Micromonosporaceae bacterium]|nr:hypothetical protein [Micromonosporaceae bacterium]
MTPPHPQVAPGIPLGVTATSPFGPVSAPLGSLSTSPLGCRTSDCHASASGRARRQPELTCCGAAAASWNRHQPDRAWIEWGFCWPPFSVARPRCLTCHEPWPCTEALAALDHLDTRGQHVPVAIPSQTREAP